MKKPPQKTPRPTYKELEKENQQLKKTAAALAASERSYRELVESANSMMFRLDLAGNVKFINVFAQAFFGYPEKGILGKNVVGTIVPETESSGRNLATMIKDLGLHPERYINNENENIKSDGQKVWIAWTNKGVQDEAGNLSEILCVGNDITRRKEAEKALVEKEIQLRTAIESLPFDFFALDETGRYIMQNAACKKHWGDLIGQRPKDSGVDKATLDLWEDNNRRAFAGEVIEGAVALQPHGKEGFYHNIISPIHDGDRIRGILGVNIDITKHKQAEEALSESEAKFRALAESAPAAILIIAGEKLLYVNPAFESISGFTAEEALTMRFWDFVHPDMQELVKERGVARQRGEAVPARYELKALIKDGQERWFDLAAASINYGGQTATLAMAYDITESKRAEEALLQSEKKYKALVEQSLQGMVIIQDSRIVFTNEAFAKIYGYTIEELYSLSPEKVLALIHPDDQKLVERRLNDRLIGKPVPQHHEFRGIRKDGAECLLEIYANLIMYGGSPAVQGTFLDITERKQAQKALLKHKKELEDKAHDLEEMNAALRVLLKKREDDRVELEEKIHFNVKQLIEPYLDNLKNTRLSSRQATLFGIIKTNLDEIISPFARNFASIKYKLTPQEIKIASLIRQGKTTKEIAELMGLSLRTIEFHRTKIRHKFGLKNKTDSLQAYLLSLNLH